jgi:hypothetical protein
MQIYQYHPVTREYLGTKPARLDPKEAELGNTRYLIPSNAVTEAPPETRQNEVAVRENNRWTVKSNYRGTTAYTTDGSLYEITEIGEVPEITTPPPANFKKPVWNGSSWSEGQAAKKRQEQRLTETKHELVEVVEDLFSVLIDKNVIRLSDLPQDVQDLLAERKTLKQAVGDKIKAGGH